MKQSTDALCKPTFSFDHSWADTTKSKCQITPDNDWNVVTVADFIPVDETANIVDATSITDARKVYFSVYFYNNCWCNKGDFTENGLWQKQMKVVFLAVFCFVNVKDNRNFSARVCSLFKWCLTFLSIFMTVSLV